MWLKPCKRNAPSCVTLPNHKHDLDESRVPNNPLRRIYRVDSERNLVLAADPAVGDAGEACHILFPGHEVVERELVQVRMTAGARHDLH